MPKRILAVTAPDGTQHTRQTARQYSHVVFGRASIAHALKLSGAIRPHDASNYRYACAVVAGTSEHSGQWKYETDESYARRIAEHQKTKDSAPNGEAYAELCRVERLAGVRKAEAEGRYQTYRALGWCGRLDLAQKLASSSAERYVDIVIVEVA